MANGAQDEPPLVPQKRFNGAERGAARRCRAVGCAAKRGGEKTDRFPFLGDDPTARSAARRCDAERRSGERGIDEPPLVPQEQFNEAERRRAMRDAAGRGRAMV